MARRRSAWHSGESGPAPRAATSSRRLNGHGSASARNSASPLSSACPISWPTRRLAMRSRALSCPAAKVAARPLSDTGRASPFCSRWNSPNVSWSSAISTGSDGRLKGASSCAGGVSSAAAGASVTVTAAADSSRTCSRRWPSARQSTFRPRSAISTRVPPVSSSSRPTFRPRSTEPRTSSAWPSSCCAAVVSSRRVPLCVPASQNRKPQASTASIASPGSHHTRRWRRIARNVLKTRSPGRNAVAGCGRAGHRPRQEQGPGRRAHARATP